jgi:hypothetical protein
VTVTDESKGTQTVVQSNGEGFWRVDDAQVFVISGVYQPPFGKHRMFFPTAVVSWTISSGATVSAALPPGKAVRALHRPTPSAAWIKASITTSTDPAAAATAVPTKERARLCCTPARSIPLPARFSSSRLQHCRSALDRALSVALPSQPSVRVYLADASLLEDIPITDRLKGQFQFQAFSVFNHPALDLPNASDARCVDCSTGGVITNIDSNIAMRQSQGAFRMEF